ncbi:response regulator transcription factor [Nannocystis radixulma]|uniref:Response regulator transcription factor n=1 Tax=Nannocystis radixulma TaxID=2995305 RepID=A0ABT5BH50_9BACT|nr:response regulator transcription factor [Nannocystis radixulma]MDC0673466.1 response regulator transcription factor [Nannocystis radixulma]
MKALIVEDDVKVALFISRVLSEEGWVTDQCTHGLDAVRQARSVEYDIILLDWMLPDIDGLAVCRELRRAGSVAPIIMLTARGEVSERVLGLEAGADDYMVKPFEIDELLARIGALLRRTQGFGRLVVGVLEIDRLRRVVTLESKPVDLTGREYALLLCLASQEGRVVARSELLAQVWATHFDPGSNLIDVQISRLRDKLGDHAWMIDTVRGKGYRLRRDSP